jgi:lipid A 3-O-deacylase
MRIMRGTSRLFGMQGQDVPFGRMVSYLRHLLAAIILVLAFDASQIGSAVAQSGPGDSLHLGPVEALGTQPSRVELGVGAEDVIGTHDGHQTFGADAEYHFGQKLYSFGPTVGVIANSHGGGMAYAALYSDLALGPVIVTPLGGIGAWWHGDHGDQELGGTFEFRISIEAAYQFANLSRFGLRLGHISNADLHTKNPGENDLMLTYALPLSF